MNPFSPPRLLFSILLLTWVAASCQPLGLGASPTPAVGTPTDAQPFRLTLNLVAYGAPPLFPSDYTRWLENKFNLKLDIRWMPYDQWDNLTNLAVSTGDIPVLLNVNSPDEGIFPSSLVQAIDQGEIKDLTSIIQSPDFARKYPNLAKIPLATWNNVTFNGHFYAIPHNIEPITFGGLCIRRDLFERAGLNEPEDLPKTTDDLFSLLLKLNKVVPPGGYALNFWGDDFDSDWIKGLANAFTGVSDWDISPDGIFTYQSFMPEYKDFLSYLRELYRQHALSPEFPLGQSSQDWWDGKVAVEMYHYHICNRERNPLTGALSPSGWRPSGPLDFSPISLINAPPVKGPKGYSVTANRGFWSLSVINSSVTDAQLDAILQFVDWLSSDSVSLSRWEQFLPYRLGYYTIVDGSPELTKKAEEEGLLDWTTWWGYRTWGGTPEDWVNNRILAGIPGEDLQEMERTMNAHYTAYLASPGIRLQSLRYHSPTFATHWSELTSQLNEKRVKFVLGQLSEAGWDAYVAGIVNSNLYRQIQAEFQNAWENQE